MKYLEAHPFVAFLGTLVVVGAVYLALVKYEGAPLPGANIA
jgi:hypothetical protein